MALLVVPLSVTEQNSLFASSKLIPHQVPLITGKDNPWKQHFQRLHADRAVGQVKPFMDSLAPELPRFLSRLLIAQLLEHLQRLGLVDFLPTGGQQTITILLRVANIVAQLFISRGVIEIAVGVGRNESSLVR